MGIEAAGRGLSKSKQMCAAHVGAELRCGLGGPKRSC